ncbi:sulfite exporter TauE/SafE family protein [Shewanella maritima]|uniref:Probable membrane transporter protein n=1 Tax=Shewanella maritima TaxID=2520507 RepID=A0A411PJZ8_9GAMM|nr:sulfite exporter TauE/SafE family protein [Shewanella maritima]QBF83901.1 sulfite exporter TauE/SafE family protein [Shewanella maritima]
MDNIFLIFSICLAIGAIVGFLAGLLGIGGGLIIVPSLIYLLPWAGFDNEQLTHVAIATSLATIILTSLSSARAHHKQGNIPWPLFKSIVPGIAVGALSSAFISEQISSDKLQQVFAVFVVLMALQMAFQFKPSKSETMPSLTVMFICSLLIAMVAGLMGIGGGVLLVPFLSYCGLQMRQAVGFSSATGFLIAFVGTVGYVLAGLNVDQMPMGTLGYIYIPALIGIILSSMLVAPFGAKAATVWPTKVLKRIFALLLFVVGIKLMWF